LRAPRVTEAQLGADDDESRSGTSDSDRTTPSEGERSISDMSSSSGGSYGSVQANGQPKYLTREQTRRLRKVHDLEVKEYVNFKQNLVVLFHVILNSISKASEQEVYRFIRPADFNACDPCKLLKAIRKSHTRSGTGQDELEFTRQLKEFRTVKQYPGESTLDYMSVSWTSFGSSNSTDTMSAAACKSRLS